MDTKNYSVLTVFVDSSLMQWNWLLGIWVYLFVAHRLFLCFSLENGCQCEVLVFCDILVWGTYG